MSEECKAVYYGKVELISGVIGDGYVLGNGTAVMSERGAADLLGMDHKALERMGTNSLLKTLNQFINKDFSMGTNSLPKTLNPFTDEDSIVETNLVEVTAENSPYQGRKIVVYTAKTIETLIRAYAFAFASGKLRKSQQHIGRRCVFLLGALVRTALDAAIREACGLPLYIQKTAQGYVVDSMAIARELGLKSSVEGRDLITKNDLATFLGVKPSKVGYYLRKYREYLNPVNLNYQERHAMGSRATHLKAYPLYEGLRVALAMDSVTGIQLKEKFFGPVGIFAKPDTREEIHWEAKLLRTLLLRCSQRARAGTVYHTGLQFGTFRS